MATWPLLNAALPDNFRQISQNEAFPEIKILMFSTICVKWAGDHFTLKEHNICAKIKRFCTCSFPVTLTLDLLILVLHDHSLE